MAQFRRVEPHRQALCAVRAVAQRYQRRRQLRNREASGGRREAVLSAGRIAAGGNATGASTVGVGSSAGDAGACVGGEIASPSTVPLPACAGVTGLSELVGGASACVGAATLSWACPAGAFVASRATSTGGSCASVGSSMGGVRASPGGAAAVRGVTDACSRGGCDQVCCMRVSLAPGSDGAACGVRGRARASTSRATGEETVVVSLSGSAAGCPGAAEAGGAACSACASTGNEFQGTLSWGSSFACCAVDTHPVMAGEGPPSTSC